MSRIVEHYDPWKDESVVCDKCGWRGTGADLAQGELFSELYEMNCPACGEVVLIVSLPTIEQAAEHRDEMSPLAREVFEKGESAFAKYERNQLRNPAQLPEIPGVEEFALKWDMNWEVVDAFDRTNQIKHGEEVIWEEMAMYESYGRFGEIATILKAKYGKRLVDLIPTDSSHTYLWGDRLSSPTFTDGVRRWLRSNDPKDLPLSMRG